MSSFLQEMARQSRARVRTARAGASEQSLRDRLPDLPGAHRVDQDRFALICEIKRRSPANGALSNEGSIIEQAQSYVRGGASAISVLTEPSRFDGSLADLKAVSAVADSTPVLRKDFLVDPYQLVEARLAGASGILLISELLPGDSLQRMLDQAHELGLFVLLEAFGTAQLERALPHEADDVLIGINCRDLHDLSVDPNRFQDAAELVRGHRVIAESGLHGVEDLQAVHRLGYGGALIGTALMTASDPEAQVRALVDTVKLAEEVVR